MIRTRLPLPILSALLLLALATSNAQAADAAAAVQAFNDAITANDTEAAVAQLAGGGVQFTLRSLHDGVNPEKMVTPIADHWSMILPVVFASTSKYSRTVEILSSESHGDLATVWTAVNTVSIRTDSETATENAFTETYLLVSTADGWKIAAIADNRQATKIAGAAE